MTPSTTILEDGIQKNTSNLLNVYYLKNIDYQIHGKDWKAIAKCIGTRTPEQVRSHAQKYFAKIYRKAMEEKEVLEAAELIPDWTDKRLTRKKKKKVNYKEKDIILEECIREGIRKKLCRKEKEKEQTQEIKQE
jgi:SHAQKYF class myb-like DNA-binding protein